MSDENFGKSAFTAEELEAEMQEEAKRKAEHQAKLEKGFFADGISRRIVLDDIQKIPQIGKQSGKPWTEHIYSLRDAETGQVETCDVRNHSFAFTDAMKPIKQQLGTELRLGVTVLEMMTTKTGEREFNGFTYPEFSFELTVYSNDPKAAATMKQAEPPVTASKNEVAASSVPF